MTEDLVPWNPYEDGPFAQNNRNRTKSEVEHMVSLRSVHGSLQKIVEELDQDNGLIAELSVEPPQRPYESPVSYQPKLEAPAKPSIQRQSETPEVNYRSESAAPSWDQFAVMIPKRQSFADPASKSALTVTNPKDKFLQPVRSKPLDNSPDMNCASSAFVFRQFEAISRKDIIVEELDSRHAMVLLFAQATHTMLFRERFSENRKLRERIAILEEKEMENQITSSEGIRDIEAQARADIQALQVELSRQVRDEVSKMIMTEEDKHTQGSMKWLTMHEERRRHELDMESDRWLSKAMGEHLSQLQRFALQFHLYRARTQNVAALTDKHVVEMDDGDVALESTSEVEFLPSKPAYDAYGGSSVAARSAKSTKKPEAPSLTAVPDSKSYIDSVINRNKGLGDTDKKTPTTPRGTKSTVSASTPRSTKVQSPVESKVDIEANSQREREARAARLRQTKASAVAARSSSAQPAPTTQSSSVPTAPATSRGPAKNAATPIKVSVPVPLKHAASDTSPLIPSPMLKKAKRPLQIVDEAEKDQSGPSVSIPPFENEDDAESHRRAELARQQLTSLGQFEPVWGWMLKSSGVLMSWQRRFFVMTRSGKIKYTSQDPTKEDNVKWVHVLNVEDITRVESDTFADSAVRPPTDQYHNNSFYVDAVRSHRLHAGADKTQRFKFCCGNKSDMNKWMWALRNATDVVYTLEEGGLVQRSPIREHFRRMYAILSPLLCSSMQAARNGQRIADGEESHVSIELPTYRKRIQMEDDIAALEAQQREAALREKVREEEEQRYHLLSPHTARSPSPPNPDLM